MAEYLKAINEDGSVSLKIIFISSIFSIHKYEICNFVTLLTIAAQNV